MGKTATGGRRYCKEWEKEDALKEWITSVPGEDTKAACRFCRTVLRAHLSDLKDHCSTKKHKKNALPFSATRTLLDTGIKKVTVDNTTKICELKLSAHIACHSSMKTIDHLGELVKTISNKESALHRTKCTALINNVLGPSMLEELLQDISDSAYSLIIDESTDIASKKKLCVVIRYPSYTRKKIVTSFLGLVELENSTSQGITDKLLDFLKDVNLEPSKCMGLATDGCNTMAGQRNSVITKFKEINPQVTHIKCICHSLQLCSSYAMKKLPDHLEFMVSETYRYFSQSPLRQQKYASLYSTINVGEQPLKILQLADTRWLAIAPCVTRILDQYDELKLHFQVSCIYI